MIKCSAFLDKMAYNIKNKPAHIPEAFEQIGTMEVQSMMSLEQQKKMNLLQKLDRGIDDMLSGRVMTYEEARKKIEQLKKVRMDERARSSINN